MVRVGSNKPVPIDVRLLCATNMPVYDMVGEGGFRQDLLYRINTIEVRIPPLRERPGDIEALVDHYLDQYGKKYGRPGRGLSGGALEKLRAYAWPGNVRELQHAVERAVIMAEGPRLEADDFLLTAPGPAPAGEAETFDSYNLEDVERVVIERVLRKHQGNVSHAARELGLTRTSLYRRMEKYGL